MVRNIFIKAFTIRTIQNLLEQKECAFGVKKNLLAREAITGYAGSVIEQLAHLVMS